MKTLLQIRSSIYSGSGVSSQLADRFVALWRKSHPHGEVILRDLAAEPVPHLDAARFTAFLTKPHERTPEQAAVVGYSDALIRELKLADIVVLALPMYNFGVPSTLKSYIDHIARAGITFRYTENGPVGLLPGKEAFVFATRGGLYAGTPRDTQTSYVRDVLGFLGITEVEFVYAEGLAISQATKERSLLAAQTHVERLTGVEELLAH